MLETKEQKKILVIALTALLILVLINVLSPGGFSFKIKQERDVNEQALQAEQYLKYLNSLQIDRNASELVFKEILSEEDIRNEVENQLKINREIDTNNFEEIILKIDAMGNKEAAEAYATQVGDLILNFKTRSAGLAGGLFSGDLQKVEQLEKYRKIFEVRLKEITVPKRAQKAHQELLQAVIAYGETLNTAMLYARGETADIWPQVYESYYVINSKLAGFTAEFTKFVESYNIAFLAIPAYSEGLGKKSKQNTFSLIPKAQAVLGIGDVVIIAGNIPQIVREAVEEGLTAAFTQFMGEFLNKMLAKIEENYKISNFLYYTDALIAGQYTDDYLKKYVNDALDKKIIKRFIPQLSCGASNAELTPVFEAKAAQFLGFNPQSLSVNDPEYYSKLNRVGNFLSSESGWRLYYEDMARQVQSEAEKAAERELISPGLKTPRDSIDGNIKVTINSIVSAQRAGFGAIMQLGIGSAKNFISKFVSSLTQTLITQFVFKGATAGNGTVGVLVEQSTCLAAAQIQPVLPISPTEYKDPQNSQNPEELLNSECAKYPRGCNNP